MADASVPAAASLPPLSAPIKAGYGLGLYGISIAQTAFSVLLMFCYTEVFGLTPEAGGLIIFSGSAIDIIMNLSVPWLTTKISSPLGRYRPFIIYGSVLFGVSLGAMFVKPDIPVHLIFAYALVTHLFYRASYAIVLTPHSSLISRLSEDADERASIGAYKAIGSNLGTLSAAYLGISTIEWLGGSDAARGFVYFGVIFGALGGLTVMLSGMICKERVTRPAMQIDTGALGPALMLIFRNRQLLVVLGATLIFFIGYIMLNGGILYYFKYVVDAPTSGKTAILLIAAGGIFMPPLWSHAIRRTSKATIWALGCALVTLSVGSLYFASGLALASILAVFLIIGIGKSAVIMNYFALTADAVDYGHWKHGQRAEVYSFGMLAIVNKIGTAIGGGLLGILIGWSGYSANGVLSPQTIDRLSLSTTIAPAIFVAISGFMVLGFTVNATRHREILQKI